MESNIEKLFDDVDGDIIIKSSDWKLLRGHSEVLTKISGFFKSRSNVGNSAIVSIRYHHKIINHVLLALYIMFYRPEHKFGKIFDSAKHNIDRLLLLDELQITINTQPLKEVLTMSLIKNHPDDWIEFVKQHYYIFQIKDVISMFFENYLKDGTLLGEITINDIQQMDNKELQNDLLSLVFKKNQLQTNSHTKEIDLLKKSYTDEINELKREYKVSVGQLFAKLNFLRKVAKHNNSTIDNLKYYATKIVNTQIGSRNYGETFVHHNRIVEHIAELQKIE